MARLERGERQRRLQTIQTVVQQNWGVKESEIADETGLHRRVVNNYLRELDGEGKAHRKGRYWYSG